MPLEPYCAFVMMSFVLILIPGPNVVLIVANSIAHGRRYGLVTVAGTSAAMVMQLALTVLGMTALLFRHGGMVRMAPVDWRSLSRIARREGMVRAPNGRDEGRASNPLSQDGLFARVPRLALQPQDAALLRSVFAAIRDPGAEPMDQLALLYTTFLVIAIVLDGTWALTADRFGRVLALNSKLRNRLTGGLLVSAGLGLALVRKS